MKGFLQIFFFLLMLLTLLACKKEIVTKHTGQKTQPKQQIKSENHEFTDVFIFDKYNDDGDYFLLIAQKNDSIFGFINDKDDRSLLKGDEIKITWKKDTVLSPAEDEKPGSANWIVAVKKLKDGPVARFRKSYGKEISYHFSDEFNYATSYLDKLYVLTEYYIATSKNTLLKDLVQNKDKIEYSIEQQTRDNKEYTMLGIGTVTEGRITKAQWLYYDAENDKLYEYDLPNDKLIEYK